MSLEGKRPLDFIVIGAQKAGTTSLFEYMRTHPQLYLPPGKEEQFFTAENVFKEGWKRYMDRVFYGAPEDSLWGTATPQYMSGGVWQNGDQIDPGPLAPETLVPKRIHKMMPNCRIFAVLRDPVERCFSHYQLLILLG